MQALNLQLPATHHRIYPHRISAGSIPLIQNVYPYDQARRPRYVSQCSARIAIAIANSLCAAFHAGDDDDTEREYDRLRDLAHAEGSKRNECYEKVSDGRFN